MLLPSTEKVLMIQRNAPLRALAGHPTRSRGVPPIDDPDGGGSELGLRESGIWKHRESLPRRIFRPLGSDWVGRWHDGWIGGVEQDLFGERTGRVDPDNSSVDVTRRKTFTGLRQIPIRREQQGQKQDANKQKIPDYRHKRRYSRLMNRGANS
jgi:hypothetical protein